MRKNRKFAALLVVVAIVLSGSFGAFSGWRQNRDTGAVTDVGWDNMGDTGFVPTTTPASVTRSYVTVDDDLTNFSNIVYSENMVLKNTNPPDVLDTDDTYVMRTAGNAEGKLTYHNLHGYSTIEVYAAALDGGYVHFNISTDSNTWLPVNPEVEITPDANGAWSLRRYTIEMPSEDYEYFGIAIGGYYAYDVVLSRVVLNTKTIIQEELFKREEKYVVFNDDCSALAGKTADNVKVDWLGDDVYKSAKFIELFGEGADNAFIGINTTGGKEAFGSVSYDVTNATEFIAYIKTLTGSINDYAKIRVSYDNIDYIDSSFHITTIGGSGDNSYYKFSYTVEPDVKSVQVFMHGWDFWDPMILHAIVQTDPSQDFEPAAQYDDVMYGTHARQGMDIKVPASANPVPFVVFIHGGGWVNGSKADYSGLSAGVNALGYAYVSINYRLTASLGATRPLDYDTNHPEWYVKDPNATPEEVATPWLGMYNDIKAALQHLYDNATTYNLNVSATALIGGSAGAHLSALYAYRSYKLNDSPIPVTMVGLNSPPLDLHKTTGDFAQLESLGFNAAKSMIEMVIGGSFESTALTGPASPLTYIDVPGGVMPHAVIAYATNDELIPNTQAPAFALQLQAMGCTSVITEINGDHASTWSTTFDQRVADALAVYVPKVVA